MSKKLKVIPFILLGVLILLIACRKRILSDEIAEVSLSQKFFSHSVKTDKIILRVISEINQRNCEKEFVTNFALKNGFPIWDKPIISYPEKKPILANNFSQSNIEDPAADTFAYIPIVPENSDKVNGFILAKISNGVELLYSLAQDYKAFSFESNGNLNDASKFVLTNLLLNKEVFGVSNYKITDYNLFTGDPETDKANSLSIEGKLAAGQCAIISWQTQHCGTPNYSGCIPTCDNCGTYCYPITSSIEICIAPNTVNWPPGGIGINTNGGGGSSGSGGGEIPHYYPCTSTPQSVLPGDPPPPCPAPGPGSGWTPQPFNANNPCNVVDSLLKTQTFSKLLSKLRDSTPNSYEIGYSQTNTLNPSIYSENYFSGQNEPDSLSVNVILNGAADGVAHNHNNNPLRLHNFSAEDIYKLAYYWSIGKINNLSTFSYTVVTDSTSYILMIEDSTAFISFARTWFDSERHFDAFKTHLYINHGYAKDGNSIADDEKTFLSALQDPPLNGAGFKLFRGNKSMSGFTPIHVLASGLVKPNPCN